MRRQHWAVGPEGSRGSPCPPVWLMIVTAIRSRGPGMTPDSTATLAPRSVPPASRTVVTPASSVRFRWAAEL